MDPDREALVDGLFRSVQVAHIQGIMELRHAPTLERMLENYRSGFKCYTGLPQAVPRRARVQRFLRAEFPAVTDILAACYDPDKKRMLANLETQSELLTRMPHITDFLGHGEGSGSA